MSQAHAAAAVGGGKVVILGGQGFIGRSVARAILSASPTVRVQLASRRINPKSPPLLTTKQSDLASFLPPTSPPSLLSRVLPPCHADITDPASLAKACADATGIVNLVGIMHEQHPKYTFDSVHEHGPRSVAKVAKEVGARLVHVSAIGADPESDIPYARSKGRGEDAVRSVLRDEVTIIRPSIVFGPDDDFFNRFAKLATILPVVPVFGGGETRFQPVYVEDLAKGIAASVLSPKPIGKTIEAGGPNVYTYADMMKLMLQQANMWRPVVSVPWFVGNVQGMVFEKLPLNLFTLTRDQVRLLKFDNVVGEGAETLEALGVHLTPAEEVLHTYL
ncbi:NAD(P)-binding protein, partial [Fimicolochytrium jonesii]|uniref:NAD(P)-binding protein n=1 Tax=Fimicolochytrium jonesii TaxID=1396493 RepID=UPI0022FEF773